MLEIKIKKNNSNRCNNKKNKLKKSPRGDYRLHHK